MRAWLLGNFVWFIYSLLRATWRVNLIEPESLKKALRDRTPCVFAHWHGDELALIQLLGSYRVATIISTSKDGAIMSQVARNAGALASRGSSTRGSVAGTLGLLRLMKSQNRTCSMAVDGPKGPIYKVKPGVFEISRIAQAPIFSGGVACDKAWRFQKSWNKTYLPKPFAKIVIYWNEPIPPIAKNHDVRDPELADSLGLMIHSARESANSHLKLA